MYTHHFSIANIPFGIASSSTHIEQSIATRLGDDVIFLDILAASGLLPSLSETILETFSQKTLNAFASLPKSAHTSTRKALQSLLSSRSIACLPTQSTSPIAAVTMHLPVSIGDFTDFSCSKDHVLNAGEAIMKKRSLPPGFLHFPIGYAGRASSIVVSGTPITRPKGQFRDPRKGGEIVFEATRELDYELEVACVIGKASQLGSPVSIADADEHIFGLLLLNDWSARDIQSLEMPPLGPLNGKSFATSISPWVITLDALAPFEVPAPLRESTSTTAYYLKDPKLHPTYAIHLQADLIIKKFPTTICKSELGNMYWTFRDLVAHLTSNGCCINTGDLLGTGTISGAGDDEHGCFLELTKGGEVSFSVVSGSEATKRIYLEDGDVIKISGWAGEGVGFGDCVGTVLSAN